MNTLFSHYLLLALIVISLMGLTSLVGRDYVSTASKLVAGDLDKLVCSSNVVVCPSTSLIGELTGIPTAEAFSGQICQRATSGTPLVAMHISEKGMNFIEGYEGNAGMLPISKWLSGDAYGLYEDGEGNCTVGIGHMIHEGKCTSEDISSQKNSFPNGETRSDALQMFREDLFYVERGVNKNLKVHLTQYQFDALADFAFNEGVDRLEGSKLLKDINAGKCDASVITKDFMKFTRDGLLIDRRNDEAKLFNEGVYPQWENFFLWVSHTTRNMQTTV